MTAKILVIEADGTRFEFPLRDDYNLHVQTMNEMVGPTERRQGLGLVISGFIENPPNRVVAEDGTTLGQYAMDGQQQTSAP